MRHWTRSHENDAAGCRITPTLTRPSRRADFVGMPSILRYSVADVRAMPDDHNRYETIHGTLLVTPAPAPRHQLVLGRLHVLLARYTDEHQLGWVFFAPTDVVLGPFTLVEPDLLFVPRQRRNDITDREITAAPDLVVEVLSPTTARYDRGIKRALYREQRVREYWLVDLAASRVDVWRPAAAAAEVRNDTLHWQPEPDIAPLIIDLADLFRPL